jgi:hypothetical protein
MNGSYAAIGSWAMSPWASRSASASARLSAVDRRFRNVSSASVLVHVESPLFQLAITLRRRQHQVEHLSWIERAVAAPPVGSTQGALAQRATY